MDNTITLKYSELKELIFSEVLRVVSQLNLVPGDGDTIFSLNLAAKYLNLKPRTIYDMNYHNAIPVIKRGKKLCFSKKALDAWNEAGRPKCEVAIDTDLAAANSSRKRK